MKEKRKNEIKIIAGKKMRKIKIGHSLPGYLLPGPDSDEEGVEILILLGERFYKKDRYYYKECGEEKKWDKKI